MSIKTEKGAVRSGARSSSYNITKIELDNIALKRYQNIKPATDNQLKYIEDLKFKLELLNLPLPREYTMGIRGATAAHKAICAMRDIYYKEIERIKEERKCSHNL